MLDILHKKGLDISESKLSSILNCKVVSINGITGKGINSLLNIIKEDLNELDQNSNNFIYRPGRKLKAGLIESYTEIEKIEKEVLFRKEKFETNGKFNLQEINERLVVLNSPRQNLKPDKLTLKIDKFVLHRFWGLIIFFLIMSLTFTSIFWLAAP